MTMGQENRRYTASEWRKLTWRRCDRCGAPVIPHRMEIHTFGMPEPLYELSLAECTRQCSGPATFGGGGHAYLSA
jgi:hypothetical protein